MSEYAPTSTILITGATGFLGRAIAQQLANSRYRIRTTGRQTAAPANLPNYCAVDLGDRSAVASLVGGADIVIHVAGLTHDPATAEHPDEDYFRVNTEGTRSLIHAAASVGCQRFVLISSISVYGRQDSPVTERADCCATSAYAKSKLAAEQFATEIAETAGMRLAILRMAPICGEGARGNVDRLMKAIDRRAFIWIGAGDNRKSLIHVDDAARACVAAVCCNLFPNDKIFNVSSPACTMREVVAALATSLGRRIPPIRLPGLLPLRVVGGAARLPMIGAFADRASITLDKWLGEEIYDSTLFRQSFGWRSHVEIADALARQVNYYRSALSRCA